MNEQQQPTALAPRFGELPVDASMAGTLAAMGYTQPTHIQQQAIPPLRAGHDVIGLARTGSGKTAGFGIPLIEGIRTAERKVQALVLVPTRELAAQVAGELTRLGAARGVRVAAVYGGVGIGSQIATLRGLAHVVVGTPGRLIDHLTRGTLDLRQTRFVILDEADRMLDVGFAPAIDDILRRVPAPRQIALFSATFPTEVEALAARHTRNAVRITVDQPGAAIETLSQRFVRVPDSTAKTDALHEILIDKDCKLALVFRRTTHKTDKLAHDLERRGFKVAALHGRRTQAQRERALEALRNGQLSVLVATDIAARGLDIAGLTHVVNFDLPDTAENYTHRTGRTARMGADGVAITLVAPDDEEALRAIQRKLPATLRPGAAPETTGTARPISSHRGRSTASAPRLDRAARAQPTGAAQQGQRDAARQERRPLSGKQPAAGSTAGRRDLGQPRPSTVHGPGVDRTPTRVAAAGSRDGARPAGAPRPTPGNLAERHAAAAAAVDQEQGWYPFRSIYPERTRR